MHAVRLTLLVAALTVLPWATGCDALPALNQPFPLPDITRKPPASEAPPAQTEAEADSSPSDTPPLDTPQPEASVPEPDGVTPATTATGPAVWGLIGFRGFATGSQAAPNGVEFKPLFSLDFNFNLWLWQDEGVYAFTNTRFWGQKAALGVTNANQGAFDFSKREFDLDLGVAWNYYGPMEARVFAYSQNNLNRGDDLSKPFGFKDGLGLENRWYVGGSYANLGRPGFDVARATFLSVGYYPTKEMVDAYGNSFKPGPFARAYLTYNLFGPSCYLFADVQAIATQSCTPKLLFSDEGIAWRPFSNHPNLEFRVGSEDRLDFQFHELNMTFYGAVRVIY